MERGDRGGDEAIVPATTCPAGQLPLTPVDVVVTFVHCVAVVVLGVDDIMRRRDAGVSTYSVKL